MSSDSTAQRRARRELDLVDLVAIAWMQRLFIILITLIVFIPLAVMAYLSLTPTYTAGSRLLVIMDDEDLTPGAAGAGGEFMFDQIMQSEADLLASEEVRRRMLIELTGFADPEQLKSLGEGFGVSRAPNASFLIATFRNEDADVAANTVNAIVDAYLRYRVELLTGGFEGGVQARLDAAERDALSAQQSLQAFRAENGIADFETEMNSALGRLADLQGRKLAAHAGDKARIGGVVGPGRRLGLQHAGVVGHVGAGAAVPFGIDIGARQPFMFGVLRREVQRQPQARGGTFQVLRQGQVVLVLGGLGGVVLVVVINHPVQVEAFRPRHDGFETVYDEAVVPVRLAAILAAGILAGEISQSFKMELILCAVEASFCVI